MSNDFNFFRNSHVAVSNPGPRCHPLLKGTNTHPNGYMGQKFANRINGWNIVALDP